MSHETQIEFARLVEKCYQRRQKNLMLGSPRFRNHGFISTATMSGSGGSVELLCGPAEYHAEIFITSLKEQKRWSLADLMRLEGIRSWMLRNRPNTAGKSQLEAEIHCAFSLLADGLRDVAGFEWLYCSQ